MVSALGAERVKVIVVRDTTKTIVKKEQHTANNTTLTTPKKPKHGESEMPAHLKATLEEDTTE